jgi:uncharacterized membrane protein
MNTFLNSFYKYLIGFTVGVAVCTAFDKEWVLMGISLAVGSATTIASLLQKKTL